MRDDTDRLMGRIYYQNRDKNKRREQQRRKTENRKLAVMNVYTNGEGTCRHCGQGDLKLLNLDHIHNDGGKHRRQLKAEFGYEIFGDKFYRWVMKNDYPAGLQVLCQDCNQAKAGYGK